MRNLEYKRRPRPTATGHKQSLEKVNKDSLQATFKTWIRTSSHVLESCIAAYTIRTQAFRSMIGLQRLRNMYRRI
jgi:hypothetical protein